MGYFVSPIYESEMPLEAMKKRAKTHKCGECGSELNVAWGGSKGYEGYILRCGQSLEHNIMTDYKKLSKEYEEGLKLWKEKRGMDTKALMKMDKPTMLARVGQAKFPKDLTVADKQMMVEVSISYGLDPLMQELMIYQGNPYPTINARYRKAQETGKFDGIDTRPATEAERKDRHAKDGDYLYRCEVFRNDASHPFVGWGRVLEKETHGSEYLPIVKDPDRQCEKRAEAMALRKAFSMPVPFQSWEEFQEKRAGEFIEAEYKVLDKETGELTEKDTKAVSSPLPEPTPEAPPVDPEPTELKPSELVTKEDTAQLKKLLDDNGMTPEGLGRHIREFHPDWGELKAFGDLKKWQFNELLEAFKKGKA